MTLLWSIYTLAVSVGGAISNTVTIAIQSAAGFSRLPCESASCEESYGEALLCIKEVHTLYGKQMGGRKSYNPKNKGKKSYQPILTFLAETREYIAGGLHNGGPAFGQRDRGAFAPSLPGAAGHA